MGFLESGIAGGADIILIPEIPYDINLVARRILERKNQGKGFSIIVVSEGSRPLGHDVAQDPLSMMMYSLSTELAANWPPSLKN